MGDYSESLELANYYFFDKITDNLISSVNDNVIVNFSDYEAKNVSKNDLPWADIMKQLEIPVSGDEEEDFNKILETIREKINASQSKYDLNYYEWLMEHTYRVFVSLDATHEEYKDSDFILDGDFEEFLNLAI